MGSVAVVGVERVDAMERSVVELDNDIAIGRFFTILLGIMPEVPSVCALNLAGDCAGEYSVDVKKFRLKVKLGRLGILGILGKLGMVGILKDERSWSESIMALERELTCCRWFSNSVSSPREEDLEREWYSSELSEVLLRSKLGLEFDATLLLEGKC